MNTVILGIAVIGLTFGVLYTLFKPRWAIVFIVILYPMEQLLTTLSGFFASQSKFLNVMVGGLAVVGAGSAFMAGRRPLRGYINPILCMTILLYLWSAAGIAWTPDRDKAITDLIIGLPYLGLLLVFPGLLVNDLSDFRRLILPTMVIGTAIIVAIITSPNTALFSGRLGIEGTAESGKAVQNPLATATLGGTITIMALLYKPTDHQKLFKNIIRGAALSAGLAMAMLSGSRGQLLGAVGVSFVMFPFARQIKNMTQFLAVSASAVVAAMFAFMILSLVTTDDAAGRWTSDTLESGVSIRWEMIETMVGEYFGHPMYILQGLGTASFGHYWPEDNIPYIHNMPAQILTEHGLIGATIFCVLMLLIVRAAMQMLRFHKDDPGQLSIAAILIAICMYQLFLSFKQGNYFVSGSPLWWFLIMAKIHKRDMLDASPQEYWAMEYADPEEYEMSGAA